MDDARAGERLAVPRRAAGRRAGRLCIGREILPGPEHSDLQPVGRLQRPAVREHLLELLRQLLPDHDGNGRRRPRVRAVADHPRGLDAARDRRLRSDPLLEDAERNLLRALRQPARRLYGDDRRPGRGHGVAPHLRRGRRRFAAERLRHQHLQGRRQPVDPVRQHAQAAHGDPHERRGARGAAHRRGGGKAVGARHHSASPRRPWPPSTPTD